MLRRLLIICTLVASFFRPSLVHAQTPTDTAESDTDQQMVVLPTDIAAQYFRATVIAIHSQTAVPSDGHTFYTQKVTVQRADNGEQVELDVGNEFQPLNENQLLKKGTQVIISRQQIEPGRYEYVLADVYRLPTLMWLAGGFLALVILVARKQGILSIIGMALSLVILAKFVVPQILMGGNPILITLAGSFIIAVVTVYLSHGFTVHSHLALLSIMATLLAVSLLSTVAVQTGYLVGLGSENAYFLQFGQTANINLQGLLLGGIILGTLGILDDIVIAQISVVFQLKFANKKLSFSELYHRALVVGKDHVASLTNTLVLAYTAANLPLFLLFTINQAAPTWVTLNSEVIAEEIIRTLVGSIGLVLAVPLATLCAVYVVQRFQLNEKQLHADHDHA